MPFSTVSVPSLEDLDSLFIVRFCGARWINAGAAELEELGGKWAVPSFS
jgi:hypothetical protein